MFIRKIDKLLGPVYNESYEKQSIPALRLNVCVRRSGVRAFMSVCIWVPILTSVWGVFRE